MSVTQNKERKNLLLNHFLILNICQWYLLKTKDKVKNLLFNCLPVVYILKIKTKYRKSKESAP